MKNNYYHILGITPNASKAEIKTAYKHLAKLYHPDKHSGNLKYEEQFKLINEAYQTLSNNTKKLSYDWNNFQYKSNNSDPIFQYQTSFTTNYHRNFSFGKYHKDDNTQNYSERNPQKGNLKFYFKVLFLIILIVNMGLLIGYFLD